MACADCGNPNYEDWECCGSCAAKRVESWKSGDGKEMVERVQRESRPMTRKVAEDQGELL